MLSKNKVRLNYKMRFLEYNLPSRIWIKGDYIISKQNVGPEIHCVLRLDDNIRLG